MSEQEFRSKNYAVGYTLLDIHLINVARSERWHGNKPWSLSDWGVAFAGEAGEVCDAIKKLNRIRDGLVGNKDKRTEAEYYLELAKEIADTFLYLSLLAHAAGIDLESAIISKFNEVSERLGYPERL